MQEEEELATSFSLERGTLPPSSCFCAFLAGAFGREGDKPTFCSAGMMLATFTAAPVWSLLWQASAGSQPSAALGLEAGFSQRPGQTQSCSHDHPSLKHQHQQSLAKDPGKISLEYNPVPLRLLPNTPRGPDPSDAFYDFFFLSPCK